MIERRMSAREWALMIAVAVLIISAIVLWYTWPTPTGPTAEEQCFETCVEKGYKGYTYYPLTGKCDCKHGGA